MRVLINKLESIAREITAKAERRKENLASLRLSGENTSPRLNALYSILSTKTLLVLVPWLLVLPTRAQYASKDKNPGIEVLAKPGKDRVSLRWAPNHHTAWQYANSAGYKIIRHTLVADGEFVKDYEGSKVELATVKPLPLEAWEAAVDTNDFAAVAAQALYGESFVVESSRQGGTNRFRDMLDKAREAESRYSFGLFSADHNYETAKMMGLAYTDLTAREGRKYVYRIVALVRPEIIEIDTGAVFVGMEEKFELPRPVDLEAQFEESTVVLNWPTHYYRGIYTSYIVERSDDNGKSFHRVNTKPFAVSHTAENRGYNKAYFTDSVPQLGIEYQYRLRGISPFGDMGQPCRPIKIETYRKLATVPEITGATELSKDSALIKWRFPESLNDFNTGFCILSANSVTGSYKEVTGDLLSATKREQRLKLQGGINYIVIEAEDMGGKRYRSMPNLLHRADSVPPQAPTGLKGTIDTSGTVFISWNKNPETDISGYKLFYGHNRSAEFSPVIDRQIKATGYSHKIPLNTLNQKIYYKLVAFDQYVNHSGFSEILEVQKPDTIPPSAPVIRAYKMMEGKPHIGWVPATDSDIKGHLVVRSAGNKSDTLTVPEGSGNEFTDQSAITGKENLYRVLSRDRAGNTAASNTVRLFVPSTEKRGPTLALTPDRDKMQLKISWRLQGEKAARYFLYKRDKNGNLRLYKTFDGQTTSYTDRNMKAGNKYRYKVRAVHEDGRHAGFSNEEGISY